MTTRRRVLTGLGVAAASGLAGCSALEDDRERPGDNLETGDIGDVPETDLPVSALPVEVPGELLETHRTRTDDLVRAVPADPDVPNGMIATAIREERERLQERIAADRDRSPSISALGAWRRHRGNAANLFGRYRAATGTDDGEAVRRRRRDQREDHADLVADLEYRATDPIEAVLVYATVEHRLVLARRRIRPLESYPESPVEAAEQAGDAVEAVEYATAALEEAHGIREAYLGQREGAESQWPVLIDGSRTMTIAADRTRQKVEEYLDPDPTAVFDGDLEGVAARLFENASRRADAAGDPRETRFRDTGEYATALLGRTRDLASIGVMRGVVQAIEDDTLPSEVTAESITAAAADARSALAALEGASHPHLTAAVADTALSTYEYGVRRIGEEYFDPAEAEAAFRYARMFAQIAPAAAGFLVERLEKRAG